MTEKNQSNKERTERKKAKKSDEWDLELLDDWTKDLRLAFADWAKDLKLAFADWTKDLDLDWGLPDLNWSIEPEEDTTKREKEVKHDKSK